MISPYDSQTVTRGGRSYRLSWTGKEPAFAEWPFRLTDLSAPDQLLAQVMRTWRPGVGVYGIGIPIWGWRYAGRWYDSAEEVVCAVLAQPAAA